MTTAQTGPKVVLTEDSVATIPFPIPGATEAGVMAQLLNLDGSAGIVTTIIHIAAGARIPAHYHNDGAEAHYVIEGDFIENGVSFGPGAFFTHPAGVIHGPHESQNGCRVLTLQTSFVNPEAPDFHIAE